MSFLETPRFPACPSLGFMSSPGYNVTVTRVLSGREQRNALWQYPLHGYTVSIGPRMDEDVQQVLEFWHAVGGMLLGFRFKDWADYKSCRVGDTPAATDQPLVAASGSPMQYQLTKEYTFGARTQQRVISKPVSGSILIAADSVTLTEDSDYSIDYTTGLVTFLSGADGGSPAPELTWGGEFDVPVRFDTPDLPVVIQTLQIHSTDFVLREIRV